MDTIPTLAEVRAERAESVIVTALRAHRIELVYRFNDARRHLDRVDVEFQDGDATSCSLLAELDAVTDQLDELDDVIADLVHRRVRLLVD